MQFFREVGTLLLRDLRLEWRNRYALGGVLLYVLSTVVIVYTAVTRLQPMTWNALFWVIFLFAAMNAVVKSFVRENSRRHLYYYTLVDPAALLLAKTIYNAVFLFGLGLLTWLLLSLLSINPIRDSALFLYALGLGALGLSVILTFVSSIAAKAGNNTTLMAILGFPLVIPTLLLLIRISARSIGLLEGDQLSGDFTLLIAIDLLMLGLGLVLFPAVWRD